MIPPRLSPDHLARLPATVKRPEGPRPDGPVIVHLGLGAFAKAHLSAYTSRANALTGSDWQIIGVSLQRADMRDAMHPQAGLYTLVTRAPEGPVFEIIDGVREILVARENPGAVLDRLADQATKIVSLTITEKGYCHLPALGKLNLAHPDIAHDLAHPQSPRSVLGFLVAGLARRRALGLKPFTVLCCDNLPSNGKVLRELVLELAEKLDPSLQAWIAREGAFPATMVDRIVPATTPADIAEIAALLGVHDASPVMAEPFMQWAIEDHFTLNRPDWHLAGAQLVGDVAPFELMKLRLLNGAHSALAYLGALSGHATMFEASHDPRLAAYLKTLWGEIIPSVPAPAGVDLVHYTQKLLERFRNPAIRHLTSQIAMDGSQKLPQRLLGPLRWRLDHDLPSPALLLAVAGWMAYVSGGIGGGERLEIRDPLADRFTEITHKAGADIAALVDGFLGISSIFGPDLAASSGVRQPLVAHLGALKSGGVAKALEAFLDKPSNA
jgi:fructuronate reductase